MQQVGTQKLQGNFSKLVGWVSLVGDAQDVREDLGLVLLAVLSGTCILHCLRMLRVTVAQVCFHASSFLTAVLCNVNRSLSLQCERLCGNQANSMLYSEVSF